MRNRLALIFLFPIFAGCASNEFTVTLFRTGAVSGITERYSVNQDGLGTKIIALSADSESKRSTYSIDHQLTLKVRTFVKDSLAFLVPIPMRDTGEMTTGLQIDEKNVHREIMWAKVDPPKLASSALDSLYHIMLRVEAEMTSPQ
jgi:hypothetical protein